MIYSPDQFADCDPEETKEPLQEIPKAKSTQRKTIAAVCGFMELKKVKSTLYLEGFRLRRKFHSNQSGDEIHTEKVNTRPCRFGSQGKVKTTWSGKVEIYTAQGCIRGSNK